MMTTARDRLSRSDAVTVARIEAAVPDLAAASALGRALRQHGQKR